MGAYNLVSLSLHAIFNKGVIYQVHQEGLDKGSVCIFYSKIRKGENDLAWSICENQSFILWNGMK